MLAYMLIDISELQTNQLIAAFILNYTGTFLKEYFLDSYFILTSLLSFFLTPPTAYSKVSLFLLSSKSGTPRSCKHSGQCTDNMSRLNLWLYGPRYVAKAEAKEMVPAIAASRLLMDLRNISHLLWPLEIT